tara:strand:+ start:363 stop:1469 length:1107 start_codon:yes stop_codon:yes gene_type:complete
MHICKYIKYPNPFELVNHANYKKVIGHKDAKYFYQCSKCYLITMKYKNMQKHLSKYYKETYEKIRRTNHIHHSSNSKKTISAYDSVAKSLEKKMNLNKKNILDIGCYDGRLIRLIMKISKKSNFNGFDTQNYFKTQKQELLTEQKYIFTNHLRLKKKFDIITDLNTFNYIPNLRKHILKLKKLLDKNGKIYIHAVNTKTNPFHLLHGDQYRYLTPVSINNLLNDYGFSCKIFNKDKRNFEVIAHLDNKKKLKFLKDEVVSEKIEYLLGVRKKIHNFIDNHKEKARKVIIFGTTLNASFVLKCMIEKKITPLGFVDENPFRQGKKFLGLKTFSPKFLDKKSFIFLPYGKTNNYIYNKLNKNYNFKIITL